jgi:hypothetical protein
VPPWPLASGPPAEGNSRGARGGSSSVHSLNSVLGEGGVNP